MFAPTRETLSEADTWSMTVDAILAHDAKATSYLAQTLERDPDHALAHATKGLLTLSLARREMRAVAQSSHDHAVHSASSGRADSRTRAAIEALSLWLQERPRAAAQRLEAQLSEDPRDALTLKISQIIRFMLGDKAAMLVAARRVAAHFDDAHPHAAFVHGCLSFALEETGAYAEAEALGRRAVALDPRDVWGRHAVAHVLEMTGRVEEGLLWMGDARLWAHANNFRFHMFWHVALFHLERGDVARTLALYDDGVRGARTDDFRDIANAASLLARLAWRGVNVGARWEELAECAGNRVEDRELVFADLHYTLALLGAGDLAGAARLADTLRVDGRNHSSWERRSAAAKGALVAQGLIALHHGDAARAANALGTAWPDFTTFGGSDAQRDLFEKAYIEALIRSGDLERADFVLRRRLASRGGVNRYESEALARCSRKGSRSLAARLLAITPIAFAH